MMTSWPFLVREAKFSADLPHTVTSTKVVICWRSPSASLKNSLLAIVAEATGVPELVSLKVGLVTRLPVMMMRLMFIVICEVVLVVSLNGRHPASAGLGRWPLFSPSLRGSFGFRFGEQK